LYDSQFRQAALYKIARIEREIAGSEEQRDDHYQYGDGHDLPEQSLRPSSDPLREDGEDVKSSLRISVSLRKTREFLLIL
jgi:hypothetical protein